MPNVYLHGAIVPLWVQVNLGVFPFIRRFDPTFVVLAMIASVEAIFLSTFVLITQKRVAELADRRADVDLQVSLLAKHEVTRLITPRPRHPSPTAWASRRPLTNSELSELAGDVGPERVLDKLQESRGEARGFPS